jgi:aryl-alcohol dehydrogenase-like predicted oxidoreductase
MHYRFLGRTGVRVSKLAFGTMSFGNEADVDESARLFARCREAGINHFDTADVYSRGRSEEILGKLIGSTRDEIVLASKGAFPVGSDPNACGTSRYHIVRACEASLRRLGTDRIDIYYLHRHDPRTDLEEALRGLEQLVRDGKILYPALSNHAAWQVQRAVDLQEQRSFAKLACIQPMYNLLKRQVEVEILPMAHNNSLGVFPYSPLAGGLLSGKYLQDLPPSEGRLLVNKQYQFRYGAEHTRDMAQRFVNFARERNLHPAALAIAWVAAHPGVTAPLIGARNVEQLEPLLAAADLDVDQETYRALCDLTPAPAPATDRNDDGSEVDLWKR